MSTSLFTPGDEKQDEKLNPGQQDADRRFSDIAKAEEKGTFDDIADNYDKTADSSAPSTAAEYASSRESSGAGWNNNVTNDYTDDETEGLSKKVIARLKKSSPALGITGVLGVGGFILLALTSPSLLIVQMKETMVGKFNTQLSSMEARSNKLIYSKINAATSGFCNSKITIKCKFTSMSDKQVAKLKAAGIDVVPSEKTSITGRVIPKSLSYNGKDIAPADFASTAGKDANFRSALKEAYNPKYAGFVGKAWANIATHYKINKQAPELDSEKDPVKAKEKLNNIAKEGVEDTGARTRVVGDPADCKGASCTGISEADAAKINANAAAVEASITDGSAATDVRSKLSGIGGSQAASFIKITGGIDSACQVYGAETALSYAAKVIREAQLVRYTMVFFSIADAIKAGKSPDPKDVELLGKIITSTVKDSKDSNITKIGSATDSFGYKFAAYGDISASKQSMTIANRFMGGGGFVGEMSSATNSIMNLIPGGRAGAKTTCRTLSNPFVQGGSIVLGVASLFVPGANLVKIASQAAIGVSVSLVLAVIPSLLADILAGTVTHDIVGEESGNAITSASGALLSDSLAAQNGNAPMSKTDAVAYNSLQTETNDQYIADELRTTSPFDATNSHTFLGSIVSSLIPLQSSSNPITTIGSLLATSVKDLIPSSKALTTQQYSDSLNICQDPDVLDANYAADPFCNVIRGIPPKYLNKDPAVVVDELVASGDLLEDGTPAGNYAPFIDKCILNEKPLGYSDLNTGFSQAEASSCIINDSNANYYLNYTDQRVELGMSGEDNEESTGTSTVASTTVDEANLYTDSSSIACAAGTTDAGVNTGYKNGKPVTIRICELSNTTLARGGGALVNARASGIAYSMFEKMRTDLGLDKIAINSSFRTMAEQQAAKAQAGNAAATPGYSNHQMGFAFDINMGSANGGNATGYSKGVNTSYPGNKVWEWLKTNASSYHYSQYPPEGWHWSINGS